MSAAFDTLTDALRGAGKVVNVNGDGKATAQCPAHDDTTASLSIGTRRDGDGVVVYCHAGCDYTDVLAALNLTAADLFDEPRMRQAFNPTRDYRYPGGRIVHRKPDKTFPQSGNKADRSLYGANLIARDTNPVYVAEGEKDCDALVALGVVAVCSAMGAGKAGKADWSPVYGHHVVVIADNDDAGIGHANDIARLLAGRASSVKVVRAAAGKDAADHIAAGYGPAEFVAAGASPPTEPIDGAALLDDVERFAGRFLVLPTIHHLVVVVLWALHTWAMPAFYTTPRLVLESPEPESGKTRVLEVLELLCRSARLIVSTSPAAVYRRIDGAGRYPPAILQDEADAVWSRNAGAAEELRALYDNGYRRGAKVDRCVGDAKNMEVREFHVFASLAVAGLEGKIPRTITSRGITMHMRRRAPHERVDDYREREARADAAPLRERIEAWAEANLDALGAARPPMPEGVRDRRAEAWEPLLAVAGVAGGDWPARAIAACEHFECGGETEKASLGIRLLRDIRTVFADADRMFSADIVAALTKGAESEWADLWGRPLDQRRLAKELKRYGVASKDVRIGDKDRKGYTVAGDDGLAQAWVRYLRATSATSATAQVKNVGSVADISSERDKRDTERDKRDTSATEKTDPELGLFENVADVADVADVGGSVNDDPLFCFCGTELIRDESRALGLCAECALSAANTTTDDGEEKGTA
jgi:hypothetical protein